MKVILDIKDNRSPFFMELLKSFDFVQVVSKIDDKQRSQQVQDIVEAFEDVKQHADGKKNLKSADDLLNEL